MTIKWRRKYSEDANILKAFFNKLKIEQSYSSFRSKFVYFYNKFFIDYLIYFYFGWSINRQYLTKFYSATKL